MDKFNVENIVEIFKSLIDLINRQLMWISKNFEEIAENNLTSVEFFMERLSWTNNQFKKYQIREDLDIREQEKENERMKEELRLKIEETRKMQENFSFRLSEKQNQIKDMFSLIEDIKFMVDNLK